MAKQPHIPLSRGDIKRILVIKLRAVGDIVLSTPVVQNLRDYFPQSEIDFLLDKFAEDVVVGNPFVSEVVSFDRSRDSGAGIIREIRKRKYDLVIDLFSNPRSAIIAGLSGASVRVGFPFRWRRYAFNVIVHPRTGNIHNVDFNLDALRRLEIPVHHRSPFLPVTEGAEAFARDWLSQNDLERKLLVALNPGGGWVTKRWGLDHYAQLGDGISNRHGAAIVVLWGPGEESDAKIIAEKMKAPAHLSPRTTLAQLAGILRHCTALVSNDSGPMHMAAALQVPTLGIFGPTNPLQQGPFGEKNKWIRNESLDCLECSLTSCPIGNICMTELTVDRVLEAFDEMLLKASPST